MTDRDSSTSHIMMEQVDGTAVVRLDRPDRLNACTRAMAADLMALIDRVERDDAIRCIVITGKGRAFCAGADLASDDGILSGKKQSQPSEKGDDNRAAFRDFGGLLTLRLYDCLKPVIVAFNGPAAGMGVTMALAADIRLASTTARFVLPFVRRGIVPESASSWFLPRIVGLPRSLEWMLRGGAVSAEEALSAGLVRSLHPPEDLLPATLDLAQEIAGQTSPVSVALTRRLLWRMTGAASPHEAHAIESRLLYDRTSSDDIREGIASFLEKRAPDFPDPLDPEGLDLDW